MNKLFKKRKLWEILSVVLATFMVLSIGGYSIAMKYSAQINDFLNISETKINRSTDQQYQYFTRDYTDAEKADKDDYYRETCEEVESEGLVLMKNENNALPLDGDESVSLFFSGSVRFNYGTSGSSKTDTSTYKNLRKALEDQGLEVNEDLWDFYAEKEGRMVESEVYMINEVSFNKIDEDVRDTIEDYDVAIAVIARDSGEGKDISSALSDGEEKDGNQAYLSLSSEELSVLKGLTTMKKNNEVSKIIVILNTSAPVEVDFLDRTGIDVDACLWVGNVGITGIDAVAKTLVGDYVPSGKLSDTYCRDNFSSPAMAQQSYNSRKGFASIYEGWQNYDAELSQESKMYYGVYTEGIYVGYRYYETRYTDYVLQSAGVGAYDYSADVMYPFGYGLSYTTFSYSDYAVTPSTDGKSFEVSVKVTNKGDYTGKEVVEVYLQKPYTAYDKTNGVEKAAVELVGYAKTKALAKNASEIVKVTVSKEQFKSYDANGAKTYILDAGKYYLTVGNGAHEAANNILAKQGHTPANTGDRMDATGNADLVYETEVAALDVTTYAVSSYTGNAITNQLDFADLNKNDIAGVNVTYVSRSDWSGTWPKAKIVIAANDNLYNALGYNQPIKEDPNAKTPTYGKKGDLTIAKLRGVAYNDQQWEDLLDQMTYEEQSELITKGYFTTSMVKSVAKPDTKEQDGPNGLTKSEASLAFPSEGIWASTFNDELIAKVGDCLAEDALQIGLTGIYAGGVNIHRMPFGGRSHEYFSEDPFLTGSATVAETEALQKKGVMAHIKHFAFNDEEASRNGIAVWLNEQEAREIMLYPFEMVCSCDEDGHSTAHAIMTSFNRVGLVWAGASGNLLKNVLIDEWGFDGYNITDMAQSNGAAYMTYQDGIPNGTTIYLKGGSKTELNSFKDNATFAVAMRDSSHRILYAIANYSSAMNGMTPTTKVEAAVIWWQVLLVLMIVLFSVTTVASATFYTISLIKEKKADE